MRHTRARPAAMKRNATRGRARALSVALVLLAGVLIFAAQPLVTEAIGGARVQQALDSLSLPTGWSRTGPPVIQVPRRGSVLLSVVYTRTGDGTANLRDFIDLETSHGWRHVGGASDLTTAILAMDDLELGCGVLQNAGVVRVELSRSVDAWW